jgi:beta-glucosidase-like glycosyl hydrolase
LELYPFKQLFKQDLASIMIAHLHVPALDARANRPVSLSKRVVTDLLKNEMGYKGLVFTDALNMKGVKNYFPSGNAELEAFLAGNHILLFPGNIPLAVQLIKDALQNGKITEAELNERVLQILKWKEWAGLGSYRPINIANLNPSLFSSSAEQTIQKIAEQSILLLNDKHNNLPRSSQDKALVFVV